MTTLPSGTVSLLFSDIEGSTALLKRLGPAYAEALDGQRQVLRKAWADHGGTELGTEGDSFYVVFPNAEGAVGAAAQGQRGLARFEWPAGEQVRVRMGIHTGSPSVHEGAYVGMDVHRAARIAAAAHGGQVLLSSATAGLVTDCLPEQATLKDLGSHQLKDIAHPERLFQLSVQALQKEFPPPRSLGTISSLPRPATPLVGRRGELAELTTLLSSPDVRLVTLTGPGGSGKTRLAIAVAERLANRFLDGLFFVPLASATAEEVMWTTIGEALDVPPAGRTRPEFFQHVTHRRALLILDNLEQVQGADDVVAQLLEVASALVVIATSRRTLAIPGEHVHVVSPLGLPDSVDLKQAGSADAVQLFVQHARTFKSSFTLNTGNAADVAEVCRRLDGLPLAIELAAARTRLLSPAALLARLDKALDIPSTGHQAPSRQQTLRDTIAWSYDLLDQHQQRFFSRLGVFAGGADLDAITAVTRDLLHGADPLDLVGDLVDANLVTINEDDRGEPRVGMLETIRTYAQDQLAAAGEVAAVRLMHAEHYRGVAERLRPDLERTTEQVVAARRGFEVEHGNLREALTWALKPDSPAPPSRQHQELGLHLCAQIGQFWTDFGYYAEGTRWLQRAISLSGGQPNADLAHCLQCHGLLTFFNEDSDRGLALVRRSVEMWRLLGDRSSLADALRMLGSFETELGELQPARETLQQGINAAEDAGDERTKAHVLYALANLKAHEHQFVKAIELYDEALSLLSEADGRKAALTAWNRACTLRIMGRPNDAAQGFNALLPQALQIFNVAAITSLAEDYGAVLAELGEYDQAVRLLGAAEAMRTRTATPRPALQEAEIAEPFQKVQAKLSQDAWDHEYQTGHRLSVEEALTEARTRGSK